MSRAGDTGRAAGEVIGRDAELAAARRLVDAARAGRSGVLAVTGEAGVGKTTLLRHLVDELDADVRVVATVGVEGGPELPYAGLHDLCRPLLDALSRVPGPQADALRAALALAPATEAAHPFAIAAGFLGLLAAAADSAPLLVVVDDLQWLDEGSATALGFAVRRLADEGVAVLLGCRLDTEVRLDLRGLDTLDLAPLADADARELARRRLPAGTPEGVVDRLVAAAAGNPLALVELAAALGPAQTAGRAPLPAVPPVGGRARGLFEARVRRLPADTRRALTVVAASPTGRHDRVVTACRRLGLDPDALVDGGLAGLVTAAGDAFRFIHPLARSAIYHLAPPDERRGAHRALAEVAGAAGDELLAAWHLAAAADAPDDAVAAALDRAAAQAASRGAFGSAARALDRAADLTVDRRRAVQRLLAAAETAMVAGDIQQVSRLLDSAERDAVDERDDAELLRLRGRVAAMGAASVQGLCTRMATASEVFAADDPAKAVGMLVDAVVVGAYSAEREDAAQAATAAVALAERADPYSRSLAAAAQTAAFALAGRRTTGETVGRLVDLLDATTSPAVAGMVVQVAGTSLAATERYPEAAELLQRFVATARRLSALGSLPAALSFLANTAYYTADVDTAAMAAAEALRLGESLGQDTAVMYAHVCLAMLGAMRGRPDVVATHAAAARGYFASTGAETFRTTLLMVEGLTALGAGDATDAAAAYDELDTLMPGVAVSGLLGWDGDHVEALLRAGRLDDALRRLERLESVLVPDGNPWAHAAAARCRGLLAPAHEVDERFAEAMRWHERSASPLERARTELCWGERLAETGRAEPARQQLMRALRTFEGLGADGWARVARSLLAGLGESPAEPPQLLVDRLGVEELQVARAVADGHTVAEVAAELYLSPQTVRRRLDAATRAEPAGEAVAVQVLGGFAVRRGDTLVTPPAGVPAQALKVVAALGGRVSLDELADALWPDDAYQGRSRLRNVLSRLRQHVGPVVVRQDAEVTLAAGVTVDLAMFDDLAARALTATGDAAVAMAREAVAGYGGELLPADRYQDWTARVRERVRRRHLDLLDLLAGDADQRGNLGEALHWVQAALDAEPYEEHRYLTAARLLARDGRAAAAMAMLRRARETAAELDVPPSAALLAVERELHRD